jgi:hypothetical protein
MGYGLQGPVTATDTAKWPAYAPFFELRRSFISANFLSRAFSACSVKAVG